ncbi:MAG: hypothetical protein WC480_00975 [Patescibacteria group bacterium]
MQDKVVLYVIRVVPPGGPMSHAKDRADAAIGMAFEQLKQLLQQGDHGLPQSYITMRFWPDRQWEIDLTGSMPRVLQAVVPTAVTDGEATWAMIKLDVATFLSFCREQPLREAEVATRQVAMSLAAQRVVIEGDQAIGRQILEMIVRAEIKLPAA